MQNKSLQMIKAILKSAFGLFLYSCGVYLTVQANIGIAPWECLSMAISGKVGLSFGFVHTVSGIIILGIDLLLKEKIGFGAECLVPVLSVVDPELMKTVPPRYTAYQGFDALFHNTEVMMSRQLCRLDFVFPSHSRQPQSLSEHDSCYCRAVRDGLRAVFLYVCRAKLRPARFSDNRLGQAVPKSSRRSGAVRHRRCGFADWLGLGWPYRHRHRHFRFCCGNGSANRLPHHAL